MLSTHILDTSLGKPADSVRVKLEKQEEDGQLHFLMDQRTNSDGRATFDVPYLKGTYKFTFEVAEYFQKSKTESFFPVVEVFFKIESTTRKYHIPLLLNPFGYSTYRGS